MVYQLRYRQIDIYMYMPHAAPKKRHSTHLTRSSYYYSILDYYAYVFSRLQEHSTQCPGADAYPRPRTLMGSIKGCPGTENGDFNGTFTFTMNNHAILMGLYGFEWCAWSKIHENPPFS